MHGKTQQKEERTIIELRSLGASMKVTRRFLPMTTVTGPFRSFTFCFVNFFTSAYFRVIHNNHSHVVSNTPLRRCASLHRH
jgi:hypothetical protein